MDRPQYKYKLIKPVPYFAYPLKLLPYINNLFVLFYYFISVYYPGNIIAIIDLQIEYIV